MKKILLLICTALFLSSCGVGIYSISSGKSDIAMISFTASKKETITVKIDDQSYTVETVKTKAYKIREIKQTALNTIKVPAGQHIVKVFQNGNEIFNKKLMLSPSEHRIIEL